MSRIPVLAIALATAFFCQQTVRAAGTPTLPSGGAFVAGKGSIAASGNALTISQSSLRSILDWNTFSIGTGGRVIFKNGSGATLNRVTGGQMSSILGSLTSSGSVYLINPQGVLIGPGANINTGGDFAASTLDISNSSFLSGGSLVFQGNSPNTVVNLGKLFSNDGSIFLLGHSVTNNGSINAANGTVGLAAGSQVLLKDSTSDQRVFVKMPGGDVTNTGNISAAQAELKANGGNIYALAGNNGGNIAANGTATIAGQAWIVSTGGATTVSGSVYARNSVETSGEHLNIGGARVKTAPGGNWLLDPVDLTIDSAAASTIETALSTSNVTLSTSATDSSGPGTTAPGNGDINVANNIAWASNNALILSAYRNIGVNNGVTISNTGAGNLTLRSDNTGIGTGAVTFTGSGNINYSASTGTVSILYNPTGLEASKYGTAVPGSYTSAITTNSSWTPPTDDSVSTQFTAYMLVNNSTDLQNISKLSGTYALGQDIDATIISSFVPIGGYTPFSGIFDGQQHTISNLSVTANQNYTGLFGNLTGIIRNINLTNEVVLGANNVGGLAGSSSGTIANGSTAGIVTLTNNNSNGSYPTVGGLVGFNFGTVINSYSTSAVTNNSSPNCSYCPHLSVGGLVGENVGAIQNSYASGAVSSTSTPNTGLGFVPFVGGLLGFNDTYATVSNSYATGSISVSNLNLVSFSISDVGGLIGQNDGIVTNSYATGSVPAAASKISPGGLLGFSSGTITSSYWDTTTSGHTNGVGSAPLNSPPASGVTGEATATLQNGSLPTGFSSSIWEAVSNSYPHLYWEGLIISGEVFNGSISSPLVSAGVNALRGGTLIGSAITNASGGFSIFEPTGTISLGSGLFAYLTSGGSGGTFSDVTPSSNGIGLPIFTNALLLINSKNTTYSGLLAALASAEGSNGPSNFAPINLALINGAASFNIDAPLTAPNNVVIASITAAVTQTSPITASGLALSGTTFTLNNANNNVATLAANTSGPITFVNSTALNIGTIGPLLNLSGVTTSDTLTLTAPTLTQTQPIVAAKLDLSGGNDYTLNNTSNQFPLITTGVNGNLQIFDSGPLTICDLGVSSLGTISIHATGDLTIGAGSDGWNGNAVVGAGSGDAVVLVTDGKFINQVGNTALALWSGTGRWLVYSQNPANDTLDGLIFGFKQYNATYGTTDSLDSMHNGLLYTTAPILGLSLTGSTAKTYDGQNSAILSSSNYAAPTGAIDGDTVSLTNLPTAGSYSDANAAGGKTVTATGLPTFSITDGSAVVYGYQLPASIFGSIGTIDKAPLTYVATSTSRAYGSANPNFSGTVTGLVGGDTFQTVGTPTFTTNAQASSNVGTFGIFGSGIVSTNYTYAQAAANSSAFTITPAQLTAGFTAYNKVYDATTAATGTLSNLSGVIGQDSVSLAGAASYNFSDANAGVAKTVIASGLSLTGTSASNYVLTLVQNGTAAITPAQLLYLATTGVTRPYGAANPSLSGTITGFLGSDTLASATTGAAVFTSPALAASNIGTYAVNGSGLNLTTANYTLAQAPGNASALNITPITTSIGNVTRQSSQPNPAFNATSSGLASSYIQSVLANLTLVTNAPVANTPGTYQITAVLPPSLAGDLIVQPGTLTITADPFNANFLPASMQTQSALPPAPFAAPSANAYIGPANSSGTYQIVIAPAQAWADSFIPGQTTASPLSAASFIETTPDSSGHKTTYSVGAH